MKSKAKKPVSFSTTLSKEAKEALSLFCVRRGLKINYFLEEIIWDRLEEEMDIEIANSSSKELPRTKKIEELKKLIGKLDIRLDVEKSGRRVKKVSEKP